MSDPTNKGILYEYAMRMLGIPYRWGGDDLIDGLDCSGLVIELLQSQGILPHRYDNTSQGLYQDLIKGGARVATPDFGVLAFFGKQQGMITHVSFCLSKTLMIEASGGDKTVVDKRTASDKNAYVKIRPIQVRSDAVAFLLPAYEWR